jgi:hypothetical protein
MKGNCLVWGDAILPHLPTRQAAFENVNTVCVMTSSDQVKTNAEPPRKRTILPNMVAIAPRTNSNWIIDDQSCTSFRGAVSNATNHVLTQPVIDLSHGNPASGLSPAGLKMHVHLLT